MRFPLGYYLACLVVYILCLPLLALLSLRAKHKASLPRRFFGVNLRLRFKPHFWFHACSFGEVKSLEPIINELLANSPHSKILISTITHTGFNEAIRLFGASSLKRVEVKFLPFEIFLPLWSKYLNELKSLVVMEAELWRMLFFVAKKNGAKTFLLNARISYKSFASYTRFKRFYRQIFRLIDVILAQSQKDKKRLESLGARNVSVFGNLKMLNPPKVSVAYKKPNKLVVLGASTHRGEEELILRAFLQFQKLKPDSLLLLAPRHPERFVEVCQILQKNNLTFERLSDLLRHASARGEDQSAITFSKDIIVLDKLGELINAYAISDIVILGGAFAKVGGHNPLEPAFFQTKLISGKHIFNQQALFSCVQNAVIVESSELANTLLNADSLLPSKVAFRPNALKELIALIN